MFLCMVGEVKKKCILLVHMERQTQSDANLRIQTVFRCLILISVVSPLARLAIFTKPLNTLKHCFILLGFVDMLLHSTPLIHNSFYILLHSSVDIELNCWFRCPYCPSRIFELQLQLCPTSSAFPSASTASTASTAPGSIQGAGGRASCQVGTPKRSWNPRWSRENSEQRMFFRGACCVLFWLRLASLREKAGRVDGTSMVGMTQKRTNPRHVEL